MLKSISRSVHLEQFSGKTVAIDAYSWLHKGAYSCSLDLVLGVANDSYITYCLNRLNLLLHYNVNPIMVFDGGALPSKLETEHKRKGSREFYREKVLACLRQGNRKDAYFHSQKCVEISPSIANRLINELKARNIQFIVAPYEADAQMAYLDKIGMVDAIISEDSDLLLFGCKNVLFKLDKSGNAEQVLLEDLAKASEFDFPSMTHEQFRQICILSGCDYLDSLPGIGIKTAIKLMKKHSGIDGVLEHLQFSNSAFSSNYHARFWRAEQTFRYQRVFDPKTEKLVYLNEIEHETLLCSSANSSSFTAYSQGILTPEDDEYFGPAFEDEIASKISQGLLNPITRQPHTPVKASKNSASPRKRIHASPRKTATSPQKISCTPNKRINSPRKQPVSSENALNVRCASLSSKRRSPYFSKPSGSSKFLGTLQSKLDNFVSF